MGRLEIKDLEVIYSGGLLAVSGFFLDVEQGGIVVLSGPIGSGKSSVLRAIAGLVKYNGSIFLDGQDLKNMSVKNRNFSYASFDSPLFEGKSVGYNLAYSLRLRQSECKYDINCMVEKSACRFAINGLLEKKVKMLTANEKRMLICARAFMRTPQLCIFNDLTRGADPSTVDFILEKILEFSLEGHRPIVLVSSSEYGSISKFGTKHVVLYSGRKIIEGNPEFLQANPPDVFSALFFHEEKINIIPAELNFSANECSINISEDILDLSKCCFQPQKETIGMFYKRHSVLIGLKNKNIADFESENSDRIFVFDEKSKKLIFTCTCQK